MFACNGILFNHESPIRWETFVTRKITRAVAQIYLWLQKKLYLGNLDAKRDRWHAKDYVEAMRLMLQQEKPEDYVIATGHAYTVRDFVNWSFAEVGVSIEWKWVWIDEKGYNKDTGGLVVEIDPKYFRPAEVDFLLGDASKATNELWRTPKYTLQEMCAEMVQSDVILFKKQKILREHGYDILQQYE